jgi:hypothetical protein
MNTHNSPNVYPADCSRHPRTPTATSRTITGDGGRERHVDVAATWCSPRHDIGATDTFPLAPRIPEWLRRARAGQLVGKDLTGAVTV